MVVNPHGSPLWFAFMGVFGGGKQWHLNTWYIRSRAIDSPHVAVIAVFKKLFVTPLYRGHYITNPNFIHYYLREILQNDHTFAVFDPPKKWEIQ